MSSRKKKKTNSQKKREARKREFQQAKSDIESIRRMRPMFKELMKIRGIDVGFLYLLDSYESKFHSLVESAIESSPSLFAVVERFENGQQIPKFDKEWPVISFDTEDGYAEYQEGDKLSGTEVELSGSMRVYTDERGEYRTVIFIDNPKTVHRENKYMMKIAILLHEVGHVIDFDQRGNFDMENNVLNGLEAEVFANLHAFTALAEHNIIPALETAMKALKKHESRQTFLGEIARKVFDRMPVIETFDWNNMIPENPVTKEEYDRLSPAVKRLLDSD